jgi:hypothetical protein
MASAPSSWRNRDILWQDLNRRSLDASAPRLSPNFAVDLSLSRLRRDKADIVRISFNIAAWIIVMETEKESKEEDQEHESQLTSDNTDLPQTLMKWENLERLRDQIINESVSEKKNSGNNVPGLQSERTSSTHFPKESSKATTATASAVMDSRSAVSRAVLCAAASIAFEELTLSFETNDKLDPLDIPQNNLHEKLNMGSVIIQAQNFGQRAIDQGLNAARRSSQRLLYHQSMQPPSRFGRIRHPFALPETKEQDAAFENTSLTIFNPNQSAITSLWLETCLPRFLSVLQKGSGHAVYCDINWGNRHARIANLINEMATRESNYGPHLIVTTQVHVESFCREFETVQASIRRTPSSRLRALEYRGSTAIRRKLRAKHFGASAQLGQQESSFHVLVTSYQDFLVDYLDFVQQPFSIVVLDEGFSWLAAAQSDPNSQLAQIWEQSIFATCDAHIGLATGHDWVFGSPEMNNVKDAWIGLTCRHRILTTPSLSLSHKQRSMTLPGLITCILPHFADVMSEEWDRCRITHDPPSLEHFKKLLTRSIVVYAPNADEPKALQVLASASMDGVLVVDEEIVPPPPRFFTDEDFVIEGKISQSRRAALAWFSPWMRYELGNASFQKILEYMKESSRHGHVCYEIIPASVTSSSGASGAIIGSLAYRLGVRCCRSFGSEQGLRQHIAALHAPPGTWLCRTCGSDCGTSQARTHHERTCGQPEVGTDNVGSKEGGASSNVGPPGVVGKKTKGAKKIPESKDKDADGSFRIPGYRGVWVNSAGKHFLKIENETFLQEGTEDIMYFDSVEDAAHKHDNILHKSGLSQNVEVNYNKDGSRIIYEDNMAASAAGRGVEMLGGGSSSVVPALSVINIKDLPKDVKPLLRDPRQTSRTGGNSKRHVYAYRGVCRQARKGHDRWQSQISFGGTNHYLGTFDSEWDAAAVYAWAHLILYGEEATRKAQLEGEEAAATYEREKAAMAAGEMLPPPPKAEKVKKPPKKRGKKEDLDDVDETEAKKTKKLGSKVRRFPRKLNLVLSQRLIQISLSPLYSHKRCPKFRF